MSAATDVKGHEPSVGREIQELSTYIAAARSTDLPEAIVERATIHVVDAIAAMVSGSRLGPGLAGQNYTARDDLGQTCTIVGTPQRASITGAVMTNGMAAHADETDDSHAASLSHPGCAVVPAALAVAESVGSSGADVLRAVAAGYDVGTRAVLSLGRPVFDASTSQHSTHAFAGLFGSVTAASVLLGLDEEQVRHALSYAAQSAAGITTWVRDPHHVEKAFVFAGMPASNGVRAALLVASGCDGVADVFEGPANFIDAYAVSDGGDRAALTKDLGRTFEIANTTIKKYSVGSPAQAAVQAAIDLIEHDRVDHRDVHSIEIALPSDIAAVVDDRHIAAINCQYLVAATLIDGAFSFAMAHDDDRLGDPDVLRIRQATKLIADDGLRGQRGAIVTVRTTSGEHFQRTVTRVRGTAGDPMNLDEVVEKALDLMRMVLGDEQSASVLAQVCRIQEADDIRRILSTLAPIER